MQAGLGVIAGVVVAAVGALILGEYPLDGALAYLAAALFGIAVAEAIITPAKTNAPAVVVVGALLTAVGFMWAAWIEAGRDWSFVAANSWVAAVAGGAATAFWIRTFGRRGAGSRPATTRTPDGP